jgi:hypothetical protein
LEGKFNLRRDLAQDTCPGCIRSAAFAAVISGVLLGLGLINAFFLLPLQFIKSRRGASPFVFAALGSLLIGGMFWLLRGPETGDLLVFLPAVGMVAGLAILSWNDLVSDFVLSPWLRITLAAFVAATSTAVGLIALDSPEVWQQVADLLADSPELAPLFQGAMPGGSTELVSLMRAVISRSLVFSSGLGLLMAYGVGRAMARGSLELIRPLSRFALPAAMVWGFILPAAGLMLAERFAFEVGAVIFWNLFLLVVLLYGLKGLAIIANASLRRPLLRAALPGLIIIGVLVPGINIVLAIALVLLGISSVWIRYSDGTDVSEDGDAGSAGDA